MHCQGKEEGELLKGARLGAQEGLDQERTTLRLNSCPTPTSQLSSLHLPDFLLAQRWSLSSAYIRIYVNLVKPHSLPSTTLGKMDGHTLL